MDKNGLAILDDLVYELDTCWEVDLDFHTVFVIDVNLVVGEVVWEVLSEIVPTYQDVGDPSGLETLLPHRPMPVAEIELVQNLVNLRVSLIALLGQDDLVHILFDASVTEVQRISLGGLPSPSPTDTQLRWVDIFDVILEELHEL